MLLVRKQRIRYGRHYSRTLYYYNYWGVGRKIKMYQGGLIYCIVISWWLKKNIYKITNNFGNVGKIGRLQIFSRISTGQRYKNRPVHGISYSTVSGRACTKRVCEPREARVAHCRPLRRSARPLRTEHSSSAQTADGWHSWTTDGDRVDNNNNNEL